MFEASLCVNSSRVNQLSAQGLLGVTVHKREVRTTGECALPVLGGTLCHVCGVGSIPSSICEGEKRGGVGSLDGCLQLTFILHHL